MIHGEERVVRVRTAEVVSALLAILDFVSDIFALWEVISFQKEYCRKNYYWRICKMKRNFTCDCGTYAEGAPYIIILMIISLCLTFQCNCILYVWLQKGNECFNFRNPFTFGFLLLSAIVAPVHLASNVLQGFIKTKKDADKIAFVWLPVIVVSICCITEATTLMTTLKAGLWKTEGKNEPSDKLILYGVVLCNMIEDIPMIILQIWFLSLSGSRPIVVISLVLSAYRLVGDSARKLFIATSDTLE